MNVIPVQTGIQQKRAIRIFMLRGCRPGMTITKMEIHEWNVYKTGFPGIGDRSFLF
jgi:hypothetical protein